jgi:hypothetical protein
MAADDLRFPAADELHDVHADEMRALLQASYAAQPMHDAAHTDRVARGVLAQAMHANTAGARGVRPRWWWGAAAAAMLMVVVMRPWRPDATQREADSAMARSAATSVQADGLPSGSTAEESGGTVRFEFTLPNAVREVALVGDFNGWDTDATPMIRQGTDGTWSARVPLEPGRHAYAFVVDGQRWVVDPLAPQTDDSGFGPTNAVVVDGGTSR